MIENKETDERLKKYQRNLEKLMISVTQHFWRSITLIVFNFYHFTHLISISKFPGFKLLLVYVAE